MKVTSNKRRRGISGILAGVILFAMLFTAGMAFFTYQNALTNQYNHAEALYQSSNQAKASESASLLPYPNKPGGTLNVSSLVSNAGSSYLNISAIFVEDQTGRIACITPIVGSLTDCRPYYGHTSMKVSLTQTILSTGAATNFTTDIRSTDASVSSCSTKTPCFFGIITSRGNVFTGLYPGPPPVSIPVTISTTLNATFIAPGGHVHDTSLLFGVSANAGGNVKYYYFGDGVCGNGQSLVSTQTVTNGLVPNSDNGLSGTKFPAVGYYSWEAVYSGDSHNSGATSLCEPLVVSPSASCTPSQTQFCFATVAQGLGSIAFDFNSFKWYNSGNCQVWGSNTIGLAPQNSCTLKDGLAGAFSIGGKNPAPLAYTISQTGMTNAGTNLFFSMNVTNADPGKRPIVLDQYSQLWFSWFCPEVLGGNGPCAPGPHGQIATTYYGLVNMTKPNPSNPTTKVLPSITLAYGQTATLFFGMQENFGGTTPGIPLCGFSTSIPYTSQITPAFIFFHGTIGGNSFGEDFPLAVTLWTNIGASC